MRRVLWRFVRLVREHRIDTVFSFLIHANVVAAVGAIFLRKVRFIQSIQTTQPNPWWHWTLQATAHEAAGASSLCRRNPRRLRRWPEWSGGNPPR